VLNRLVDAVTNLPVIRTFISLPAGIARMPFWRFTLSTAVGSLPWVLALTLLGVQVGSKWDEWHKRLEVLDLRRRRGHRRRRRVPARAPEAQERTGLSRRPPGDRPPSSPAVWAAPG
jgi:hypothetical protein